MLVILKLVATSGTTDGNTNTNTNINSNVVPKITPPSSIIPALTPSASPAIIIPSPNRKITPTPSPNVISSPNTAGQRKNYQSPTIKYLACNNDYKQPINESEISYLKWSATWNGNEFNHTPGPDAYGTQHSDKVMRYLTLDGSCWEASWDGEGNFYHKKLSTNEAHLDPVIKYLYWDRSKWSATRKDNSFEHTFIAEADR